MVLDSILNPVLYPLLNLNIAVAIVIISFLLSLTMTVIYKLVTDQDLMKQLKSELKEFQKEIKELKSHPEEAMKVQKKMMETNMKYMINSMKPTLITFIPIIIIFGWLSAHLSYAPIAPNTEFTSTIEFDTKALGEVTLTVPSDIGIIGDATKKIDGGIVGWTLIGLEGEYALEYKVNEKSYTKEIVITNNYEYADPVKTINDGIVKNINIDQKPLIVLNFLSKEQGGFFSGRWGWLGTYIVSSIIFSIVLRKLLKVY